MTSQSLELFDGEDVDVDDPQDDPLADDGPDGSDDGDLSEAELVAIMASKADPSTPGPEAEGN